MGSIFWFAVPYEGASILADCQRSRYASREAPALTLSLTPRKEEQQAQKQEATPSSPAKTSWTDEVDQVLNKTTSIMLPSRPSRGPTAAVNTLAQAAVGRDKAEVSSGKTKTASGQEGDSEVERIRKHKLSAIIVEDTPSVSKLLQKMMTSLGYEHVECYANGALGLEAMKKKWVDVVITDVNMPIMNGDKMVTAFREHEQQMIQSGERKSSQMIVACSANCNAILEAKLIQVGCDGVYAKPLARRHVLELTQEFAIEQLGNRVIEDN
jgi:CheY-like chemotaxis protein